MGSRTIQCLIEQGRKVLEDASVESPQRTAEYLLAYTLSCERLQLFLKYNVDVDEKNEKKYFEYVLRRKLREPLQYIIGTAGFLGLDFKVNPYVLIPRPETEILVEITLDVLKRFEGGPLKIADIGTGSGNIAVSLAVFLNPHRRNLSMKDAPLGPTGREALSCRIYATDISPEALHTAEKNSNDHQVSHVIQFLRGHLYSPLWELGLKGELDCIVSNPPYVDTEKLKCLEPEVKDHEPHKALNGGKEGLDLYPAIIMGAEEGLKKGGLLALEIGDEMCQEVANLFEQSTGWKDIRFSRDTNNVNRYVTAIKG